MASNTEPLPPYVRLATVHGVVAMRRTTSGLWAGRGLRKLGYAKKGFLSEEKEMLEWREVKNSCLVCMQPSTLEVQWEGPGSARPRDVRAFKSEYRGMRHQPVKVLDAHVCGICRVTMLPRLTIIAQWDLRGVKFESRDCACQWDGECIYPCNGCNHLVDHGRLLEVARALGWQVRRFTSALKSLKSPGGEEEPGTSAVTSGGNEASSPIAVPGPSAPPLYPSVDGLGYLGGEQPPGTSSPSLLETAIESAWPYLPSLGQLAMPPMATIQVPPVMRVYRDPTAPGYSPSWERLSDDEKERAQKGGWQGPWELTTWGELIRETINDPHCPLEDRPDPPKEEGIRGTSLYCHLTSLDGWGSQGARSKAKTAIYTVTPEQWYREGVLQLPGSVAARADTPIRPDQTVKVKVTVQMVVVPYRGLYSVGASVEGVDPPHGRYAAGPAQTEATPPKPTGGWFRKVFSGKRRRNPEPNN